MIDNKRWIILLFCLLIKNSVLFAQNWVNVLGAINQALSSVNQQIKNDRSSARKSINGWGECKGGAVSNSYGIVALYGDNGYCTTSDVPESLKQTLNSINNQKKEIKDVTITQNGSWLVLYDTDRCIFSGIPISLKTKLNSLENENVWSVSFNDNGDWVVITDLKIHCSNATINTFLKETMHSKGNILSVTVSETGLIACCENGFSIYGAVPTSVVNEANTANFIPKFIKFDNYGNYLICSKTSSYKYCLFDANETSPESIHFTYNYGSVNNSNVQPLTPNNSQIIPSYPINNDTYSSSRTCRGCNGTGICTMCSGRGEYWNETGYYVGKDIKTKTRCSACNGTGTCKVCYGKGKI